MRLTTLPHLRIRAAMVAVLLAASLPLTAAENPLSVVPETAAVVMRFKKPKATIDNAVKFAGALDMKFGQQLKKWSGSIGELISNPGGAGVDAKFDWFVIVFAEAQKVPGVVFAIPTNNHDALETAVKQSLPRVKFTRHDNWSFYSDNEAALLKLQDGVSGRIGSVAKSVDSESQGVIDRSDLSFYFNVRHLTRNVYNVELEAAQDEIAHAIDEVMKNATEVEGINLRAALEMYGDLGKALLQALQDTESVSLGLAVRTNGIDVEEFIRLTPDSPTAKFAQSNPPSAMTTLDKLPGNRLMYMGLHGDMKAMTRWGMNLAKSVLKDPAAIQAIEEGAKAYDEIELGTQAVAFNLGDMKEGILRTVTITEMKPPEKVREVARKTLKAVGSMNVGPVKQEITLKEEAESVGDVKVDLMTVTQELPADNPGAAFQKQLMAGLYGPEGMTTRIAYMNDVVIQTLGGGSAAMTEAVQAIAPPKKAGGTTAPVKPTPGLAGTRQKLAPTANAIIMIDLATFVGDGLRMAGEALGPLVPVQPDQIKKLGIKRSYLGISVGAESSGVRIKTHMPQIQLQGYVKLGNVLSNLIPPGGIPGLGPNNGPGAVPPATGAP